MSNSLITAYRQNLEAKGLTDDTPDDYLTRKWVADDPTLLQQYPDLAQDWAALRESNAPSLLGEAGRALTAGTQELASTGLGLGALATGSDYLKEKARSFQEEAAANAPTIPTIEDIRSVKDAARYGVAKLAGAVPSLAEGVGLAAGGAAAGAALGPEGAVAGGVEGAMEEFLGKGIVKSAIRRLLANEAITGTEESVAAAIQAGDRTLLSKVTKEATDISARRAGTAANALNMYGLNAGALYNETDNREAALVGGAAGAIPMIVLPELVINKLYPGVTKEVGQRLGNQYVTRLATEALKDAGILSTSMALQDAANTVTKNLVADKDPTDFSDADWKRIREAAIGGALAGPFAAPLTARGNAESFNPTPPKARAEAARAALAAQAATSTPAADIPTPLPAGQPATVSPARRVTLMTEDQKAARLADLSGRVATLSPDEQTELSILQATVRQPVAPAVEPAPTAEATSVPPPISVDSIAAKSIAGNTQWSPEEIQFRQDPANAAAIDAKLKSAAPPVLPAEPVVAPPVAPPAPVVSAPAELTPDAIHVLADSKGIPWDGDPAFMAFTKKLTGLEHLDDLGPDSLTKVYQAIEAGQRPDAAPPSAVPPPPAPENPPQLLAPARESGQLPPSLVPTQTAAEAKRAQTLNAAKNGTDFHYTVFRPGEGYLDAIQVDVTGPNGERLGSTNLADLKNAGATLPDVPKWVPQGSYTSEEMKAMIDRGPPPAEPVSSAPVGVQTGNNRVEAAPPAPNQELPPAAAPPTAEATSEAEAQRKYDMADATRKAREKAGLPPPKPLENLPQIMRRLGRDRVNELIGDWNSDAELSPDGSKITQVGDPRNQTGKDPASARDFMSWMAEHPDGQIPTTAPASAEQFSNADIVAQRALVRKWKDQAEKLDATNPKQAAAFRKKADAAQVKVAEMVANKLTGPGPKVGNAPDGNPDLLTDIANHIGTIQTEGDSDNAKTMRSALSEGAAKLLRGGKKGMRPDLALEAINAIGAREVSDRGAYHFQTMDDFANAVLAASANRKKLGESIVLDEYKSKMEQAFRGNDPTSRKNSLIPGEGVPIEKIGVGGKFEISGENFSVTDVEEKADGTYHYIVKDGHRFMVPEGEIVYPDKGVFTAGKGEAGGATDFLPPEPPVPPSPSATLETRLREELNKPEPVAFGKIVSFDARLPANLDDVAPKGLEQGISKTREAAILRKKSDGEILMVGLLPKRRVGSIEGGAKFGAAVQEMATKEGGTKDNPRHAIKEGGKVPALLAEVVGSGDYEYLGKVVFHPDTEPGVIFQRWANRDVFAAALKHSQEVAADNPRLREIEAQGNALRAQLESAPPNEHLDLMEQLDELAKEYRALGGEPKFMTQKPSEAPLPIQADRTAQFSAATAAARQAGIKVDVFTEGFLRASLADETSRRLDELSAHYMAAKPEDQPALQAQIERLQKQLTAVSQVRALQYNPWHIAVGLHDVQNQNINGLVALLHEVGHSVLGRSTPEMQGRIIRAVNGAMADLTAERSAAELKTGVREANLGDAEELLVSTMAQRLATEGIPDAPSLARAIVQWVKDLYYRLAMGVQAAFGRTPDPQLALDWFENQLRRTVGGDYDYRFAGLFDRFTPEPPSREVVRFDRAGGTPGDVSDFYDPITGRVRQPQVLPDTREGIAWNLKFMAEDDPAGKELDIPGPEARARIMGAALHEIGDVMEKAFADLVPKVEGQEQMPFDEFYAIVGKGDTPKSLMADLEERVPGAGAAEIGGEKMTKAMNEQARLKAKELVYKARNVVVRKAAQKTESGKRAESILVDSADKLNKVERSLRSTEMHEKTLGDSLKKMIRDLARGVKRGLDTAFAAGRLAEAVREVEGLSEREAIPEEYQKVFKAVLADEVPVFDYLSAISQLDLPLHEMTRKEILTEIENNAVGDPVLAKLIEPKNQPLLVALAVLAKSESAQMDLIQMRAIKDPKKYLALKAQLDEIRNANAAQFKELEKSTRENRKAATLADRVKQNAIKVRAKLRRAQDTILEVEGTQEILAKMRAALDAKVDEMETNGQPAPAEWMPFASESYLTMVQDKEGKWRSVERPLAWTPEGPARNAPQLLTDLARNAEYLASEGAKKGSKTYQLVQRMTQELNMVDALRQTPEIRRVWFEKFLLPSSKLLVSGGGAGAAAAERMLNRFQFILFSKWHSELENPAIEWTDKLQRATAAAGMKDRKAFLDQVYEPVLYLIQSEPGREEGPMLREAVRAARRRLTTDAAPEFDDTFKELLRSTKDMSDRFLKVAEDNGVFVKDEKLGELRHAVSRGWLTVMRSMNSATVSTVLRDMESAGWKMVFKDAKTDKAAVRRLDVGAAAGQRVVGAASFDALLPELAKDEADAKLRTEVLENPDAFSKAIGGFFTPGIVQRWLEPFINKPGEPVFAHAGEGIDPLDVQAAWQKAGGSVAKWIDLLGERVGLEQEVDLGDEMMTGDSSLEAQWRATILKRLDALFLMEARVAADSNQTRGLFDATGRPPHLIMDSRENELLPPEHVQHMAFDRDSTRSLLATLAFHAAFGRNGETMNRATAEIQSNLRARKAAFDSVMSSVATKAGREAKARDLGYDFNDLKRAAGIYQVVEQGIATLKAQFGFNSSATMLNDVRGGLEFLHFMASQTTNNPKTGLLNLLQPAQRALARKSIGIETMRDTAGAYGQIGKQFFGQVLENFGLHLLRASRHAADIGAAQGQAFGKLPWTVVAGIGAGRRGEQLPLAINAMRTIGGLQRKGLRPGFGETREFPRLNPFPVVGNVMHSIGLAAAISNGVSEARAIESVVHAAMQHFAANPDHLDDPTYRLTHEDIAAHDRIFAMDRSAFEYLRRKMVEFNIGPLEAVTRAALDRQTKGDPILTQDQVYKAAMLSGNEVDLQPSINTNPATWDTNPVLKFATPLLGWPIRQMNQVHEAMRTAEGRATALQAMKAVGILATWMLPVGLAFTFLTDQYDDKILKKKTNLGRVDPLALIPGIGAPLALATSDIPAKEHLTAMFTRLSRAGNIYGLGFDALSSTLAGMDPTSGQRPFSMDGRILAFSQLLNFTQAMSNWINSGFATTYANVERPLIQSMVGSGALQAADVIGNVLGIDNQEMRIAQRTNASQWLRAAGREVGLELRRGGGGSVAPTPSSVWTREMYLAALANDRLDFMDSYRRAVDAAREDGDPDPEAKVLESWRSRDPRDVFRLKPTDAEMSRVLNVMSDSGREAVSTALRLFEQYTEAIAPSPIERYEKRILSSATRVPGVSSLRSQMAGGALSFSNN